MPRAKKISKPRANRSSALGKTQRRKEKLASTGTKGRAAKLTKKTTKQKQPVRGTPVKSKWALRIVGGVLLAGGLGYLVYAITNGMRSSCDQYFALRDKGKDVSSLGLGPFKISECIESKCNFDYSKCKHPCPFGFRSDKKDECTVDCECALEGRFQADIQFTPEQLPEMLKTFGHTKSEDFSLFFGWTGNLWNNIEIEGRFKVPYTLQRGIYYEHSLLFEKSVRNISRMTCIDLIPGPEEKDHILVLGDVQTCSANFGRVGGSQVIKLGYGCFSQSTIHHELLHTFGFHHEHSRQDRDAYIDIFRDNIPPHLIHNFQKKTGNEWKDLGSEYDLSSGLHYGSFFFAMDKSKPTLAGKGGVIMDFEVEDRHMSHEDVRELNLLYGCKQQGTNRKGQWNDWREWSACSETCGDGRTLRYRNCIYEPTGEKLTTGCEGNTVMHEECKERDCPPKDGTWKEWSQWSACARTCGKAKRIRGRECNSENGCVPGNAWDYEDCDESVCNTEETDENGEYGQWGPWKDYWHSCDKFCGEGKEKRYRDCLKGDVVLHDPRDCLYRGGEQNVGTLGNSQYRPCVNPPCPGGDGGTVPGASTTTGSWTQWTMCDKTCGKGTMTRVRRCNAASCVGKKTETRSCGQDACPRTNLFPNKLGGGSNICSYGTIFSGKLNSDGMPDFICLHPDGFVRVYLTNQEGPTLVDDVPSWEGKTRSCVYASAGGGIEAFIEDVNTDGLDDIICRNSASKEIEVALNNGRGGFSGTIDWRGSRKGCNFVTIQDADGDRKPDLVCVDSRGKITFYSNAH